MAENATVEWFVVAERPNGERRRIRGPYRCSAAAVAVRAEIERQGTVADTNNLLILSSWDSSAPRTQET